MNSPRVSVIIPAYNQAQYLGEAIRSVLAQTFTNFELIVVDDGSTDSTASIVTKYKDPRLHYINQINKGLPEARNTGIAAAMGEYLAFLDADDIYHKDKLEVQVPVLDRNQAIGLCYSSRIEIDYLGNPLWLIKAPTEVGLVKLLLDFPFTINDILVRKSCVANIGGFNDSYKMHGEDREFYIRLLLNGCSFKWQEGYVAYRRLHHNRIYSNIGERIEIMRKALDTAFNDPRCPKNLFEHRNNASAKIFLYWSTQEFIQGDTSSGQQHLKEAWKLDKSLLNNSQNYLNHLVWSSIRNGEKHEEILRDIIKQLPTELSWISENGDLAVGKGFLLCGFRDALWGRLMEAKIHFHRASRLNTELNESIIHEITDQLINYESEYGLVASRRVIHNMQICTEGLEYNKWLRYLKSNYSLVLAFQFFQAKEYTKVFSEVIQAVVKNPSILRNRGVISIFAKSVMNIVGNK